MSPRRWRRVQALFDAVADLPPAARAAALDRSASGDDALRREVESLLVAEDAAAIFFQTLGSAIPVSILGAPLAPEAHLPWIPAAPTGPADGNRQREGRPGAAALPPQGAAAQPPPPRGAR